MHRKHNFENEKKNVDVVLLFFYKNKKKLKVFFENFWLWLTVAYLLAITPHDK